jgi:signal peptidase I
VVVEGRDDTPVLRRVLGVAGDRFQVIDGLLYRNGQPMPARTLGTFTYRDGEGADPRRQQLLEETLEAGRAHRVLGDYEGAARPWTLELPVIEVPPGHLFLICDNRRQCPLDDKLGSVPAAWVQGVARSIVWYGEARAEAPPSQPFYGAFAPLVSGVPSSGGSVTGEPRK